MSDTLPSPGSSQYMPTLLRTLLENPALEDWQFDPTLFSLLFLSLIVRRGGVCVNVGADSSLELAQDVERVVRGVRGISESIFGLNTLHVHLDPEMMPKRFHNLVLDRRKWNTTPTSRKKIEPTGYQISTPATPISPNSNRSGISTRYHSAESMPSISSRAVPDTVGRLAPVVGGFEEDSGVRIDEPEDGKHCKESEWPEILIVTGLEDCDSPIQTKLIELVKLSSRGRFDKQGMILVWIRPEAVCDKAPPWLVDNFVLSDTVLAEEIELPPHLARQTLMDPSYIRDIAALLPYTHIHPPLTQHLHNLISATSTHPNLHSVLTSRFFMTLPILVKAHRLLSAPFTLPPEWQDHLARLARPELIEGERFGLGGGKGGVDGWARKAGEEPNLSELGRGGEEWFVGPENVRGVWISAIRHRVKWRELSESVMWIMKSDAGGLLEHKEISEKRRERRAGKRRRQIEGILDDMLEIL